MSLELDLTMAIPAYLSSSSYSGSEAVGGGGGGGESKMMKRRELDINMPASGGEEEECPATRSVVLVEEEEEEEEEDGAAHRPKKLRLSKEQSRLLEESFRHHHTLNPKQKKALAAVLKLRPRQVEVWFQNRRARTKLKQTEMECEYLKRCFGSLTEENRRLQLEVEALRVLQAPPPAILSPNTHLPLPAPSFTMCPRCERVSSTIISATLAPRQTTWRSQSQSQPSVSAFHPSQRSAAC